jgi:tetratricopeptide (TPR) repeat protein
MLDAIRAYALRRLVESGEEAAVRERHLSWVRQAVSGDGSTPISLYAFDPYADELRAALEWSTAGGSAREGLRLAGVLGQWWRERHRTDEARRWLYRLYERAAPIPDHELADAYHLHASLCDQQAEAERFGRLAEQAARRAGEPALLVRVLAGRAGHLLDSGRLVEAEQAFRAVLDLAHRHRVVPDALPAVYGLAELLWRRDELDEAAELLAAARTVEQARPELRGGRTVDWLLGLVALRRGDLVAAHEHLVVALRWRLGYGFHARAGEAVQAFAVRCALGGDHLTAAQLFGAAATAGAPAASAGGYWRQWQDTVRAALGDPAFDSAFAVGTRLKLTEAVAVALTVEHPDLVAGSLRFTDVDSRAS